MESNLWRPRPNLWPLMCVGSSNPAGSRGEGLGTGKETPAGQDGTVSGDTTWSWQQPGPGRHEQPHVRVLGDGVPVVAWGASAELFFPLMSSLSCFYLPPSTLLQPHLPFPWEQGERSRIYPCSRSLLPAHDCWGACSPLGHRPAGQPRRAHSAAGHGS